MANPYYVTIEVNGGSNEGAISGQNGSTFGEISNADTNTGTNALLVGSAKVFAGVASVGFAVSMAKKVVGNRISTISLRTGRVEYQQRIEETISIVEQFASMVNPVAALSSYIDYAQRVTELRYQATVEGIGLYYLNIRASTSGRRTS